MPDWSIKIIQGTISEFGKTHSFTEFSPSRQQALVDDLISWNNQTDQEHQPWPLDSNRELAATGWGVDPIPAGESSNPAYNVALPSGTQLPDDVNFIVVPYGCKKHTTETGELEVWFRGAPTTT